MKEMQERMKEMQEGMEEVEDMQDRMEEVEKNQKRIKKDQEKTISELKEKVERLVGIIQEQERNNAKEALKKILYVYRAKSCVNTFPEFENLLEETLAKTVTMTVSERWMLVGKKEVEVPAIKVLPLQSLNIPTNKETPIMVLYLVFTSSVRLDETIARKEIGLLHDQFSVPIMCGVLRFGNTDQVKPVELKDSVFPPEVRAYNCLQFQYSKSGFVDSILSNESFAFLASELKKLL
jgi:hypothetical protein